MRSWRQRAVAASVGALAVGPSHASSPGYDRTALQADLNAIRDAGTLGVQARVVSPGGDLAAASGTAVRGRKVPIPLDGHFRMGSNTQDLRRRCDPAVGGGGPPVP
ncbi:hypothetical protein [Nonomuraea dietziae]|uniref:hypothetical protein n=1 Tax=Nonomuraea dietziae TaxID=65515 RepID=UPI0031DF55E6